MSPFTVLVLCVQACLIQSVLSCPGSGCSCGSGSYYGSSISVPSFGSSLPLTSYGSNLAVPSLGGSCGSYGGQGTGQVSAAGNIDACGNTCVVGSVPVLGSASFGGCAPACGSVSITGQCGCGCVY